MSFSTRNLDTIVESDSHSPVADPGSVILQALSSNSGKFDFSKRNSAPVTSKKSNINNNDNNSNNFIGGNTVPKTKNMEKINSNINSVPMNVHKSGIKVTVGGVKDKVREDRDRIGVRLKKSSSIHINDNQDDNSDHNSANMNNIKNTQSLNSRNSDRNIHHHTQQLTQLKQQKQHDSSRNIDNSNDEDENDPHGIRISQSASCGSANNNNNTHYNNKISHTLSNQNNHNNHNNDNTTNNTNDNIQFDDHNDTLTNNNNHINNHTLNPNPHHPHNNNPNPPSSPPWGRSRSFSTGTGTTSHLNDSSISTASSGFFSRLLATPSKRLRKLNECDNGMNRKDKDNHNHRDKEKSNSLGSNNTSHYGGYGGGEKGNERGGGCGNASERERERERGDEESVGSRGGMSVETNRVSDHYTYDDQLYEEAVYIKSKLCLRVSVKSSSRYRLCDSNPQEEGDATWACATGIFAQSFILRGDDCDTDSRLVASDRLVSIIVDSKITNVNGELKIENKHNGVKDSYNKANIGLTDNDHLSSTSEKSKKETKVY